MVGSRELRTLGVDAGYRVASATSSMIGQATWSGLSGWRGRSTPLRAPPPTSGAGSARQPRRDLAARHHREAFGFLALGACRSRRHDRGRAAPQDDASDQRGAASAASRAALPQTAARQWRGRRRAGSSGTHARRISTLRASESTSARRETRVAPRERVPRASIERRPIFERMLARRVVTDAAVANDVGLGRMQVAARRDSRAAPSATAGTASRPTAPWSSGETRRSLVVVSACAVRDRRRAREYGTIAGHDVARERDERGAGVAAERIGLRGPVQIARPTGRTG